MARVPSWTDHQSGEAKHVNWNQLGSSKEQNAKYFQKY